MITDLKYEKTKIIGTLEITKRKLISCLGDAQERVEYYRDALENSVHEEDKPILIWAIKAHDSLDEMAKELMFL